MFCAECKGKVRQAAARSGQTRGYWLEHCHDNSKCRRRGAVTL